MSERASKAAKESGPAPRAPRTRTQDKDAAPRVTGISNSARAKLLAGDAGMKHVPAAVRSLVETSFGVDMSGIAIRDDHASHNAAEALDAKAFVENGQIHWGQSAPPVESERAAPLLAHEMAHVVQQQQAGALEDRVSSPGEAAEAQAGAAAGRALAGQQAGVGGHGAVAATQRQPKNAPTQKDTDIAAEMLTAYLKKVANTRPPQNLKKAKVVRDALRKLAFSAGPSASLFDVDKFVEADSTPADPAGMASAFMARVPNVTKAALDGLSKAPFIDPQASTVSRVVDVVKGSKAGGPEETPVPGETKPEDQPKEMQEKLDAITHRQSPPTYGPYSVDIFQLWRIGKGLKPAMKAPATKAAPPEAESYPAVEAAIAKIPRNALVPAEAKGKGSDDDWADAQEFARDLAKQLDVAQKSNQDEISLNLGDNYAAVKDRQGVRQAVEAIIAKIRQALPHHAANVKYIDVRTGRSLLTRGMAEQ